LPIAFPGPGSVRHDEMFQSGCTTIDPRSFETSPSSVPPNIFKEFSILFVCLYQFPSSWVNFTPDGKITLASKWAPSLALPSSYFVRFSLPLVTSQMLRLTASVPLVYFFSSLASVHSSATIRPPDLFVIHKGSSVPKPHSRHGHLVPCSPAQNSSSKLHDANGLAPLLRFLPNGPPRQPTGYFPAWC